MPDRTFSASEADISDDEVYRYSLRRTWDQSAGSCLFVMLNPSKATAVDGDPTINKCVNYARSWGYGTLLVGNLFALRSPSPAVLYRHEDPIGPRNNETLIALGNQSDLTVVAWGAHGLHLGRGPSVLSMLRRSIPNGSVHCLRTVKNGQPGHPLYLPGDATPYPLVA